MSYKVSPNHNLYRSHLFFLCEYYSFLNFDEVITTDKHIHVKNEDMCLSSHIHNIPYLFYGHRPFSSKSRDDFAQRL